MLTGEVDNDGQVVIRIPVSGELWTAMVDTGFNGDVELPESLFDPLRPVFNGEMVFQLAGGQSIVQDTFIIDFPFDDDSFVVDATFVDGDTILIGTGLLRDYRLEADFVARTVMLERLRTR